jgi:hypothetical protein
LQLETLPCTGNTKTLEIQGGYKRTNSTYTCALMDKARRTDTATLRANILNRMSRQQQQEIDSGFIPTTTGGLRCNGIQRQSGLHQVRVLLPYISRTTALHFEPDYPAEPHEDPSAYLLNICRVVRTFSSTLR